MKLLLIGLMSLQLVIFGNQIFRALSIRKRLFEAIVHGARLGTSTSDLFVQMVLRKIPDLGVREATIGISIFFSIIILVHLCIAAFLYYVGYSLNLF